MDINAMETEGDPDLLRRRLLCAGAHGARRSRTACPPSARMICFSKGRWSAGCGPGREASAELVNGIGHGD